MSGMKPNAAVDFGEQPAQLGRRLGLGVVSGEVLLGEVGERDAHAPLAALRRGLRPLESHTRVVRAGVPATLDPSRATSVGAEAIGRQALPVGSRGLELEDLPVLQRVVSRRGVVVRHIGDRHGAGLRCGYDLTVPKREAVTVELDVEVAAMLREQAAAEHVSEGEIVERALRTADLRALVERIRGRSDLDGDAAMRLVNEELKAVRAERGPRAA
jgi:hypothetical protein